MTTARRVHHSYQEYLQSLELSSVKLEYCEGEIYPMAGGTPAHADLAGLPASPRRQSGLQQGIAPSRRRYARWWPPNPLGHLSLGLAWLTCLAELWLSVSMATLVAIMAPLALARIYFR